MQEQWLVNGTMGAEWRETIRYHGNEGRISGKRRKLSVGVSQRRRKKIKEVFSMEDPARTKVKTRSGMAQSGTWQNACSHMLTGLTLPPSSPASSHTQWPSCHLLSPSPKPRIHAFSIYSPILKLRSGLNTLPSREVTGRQ